MEFNEKLTGTIFDIQGFSVHDGPGCRTLIFFKGCSLRCEWCSNPEGIKPFTEPLFNSSICICDDLCISACPYNAISRKGEILINYEICKSCFTKDCAKACLTDALRIAGYEITLTDLIKKIERDRKFWGEGGGVTLTGGEPFMQPEFARELLKHCYDAYIHTAVETCGNVPWDNIKDALPFIDWIFYDIKHVDTQKHAKKTTASNKLIIDNLRKLASEFKGKIIIRMPVIPGFNDSEEHILKLINLMNEVNVDEINILPLHHLGKEKYSLLGRDYAYQNLEVPNIETINRIKDLFIKNNKTCYFGSETPF